MQQCSALWPSSPMLGRQEEAATRIDAQESQTRPCGDASRGAFLEHMSPSLRQDRCRRCCAGLVLLRASRPRHQAAGAPA
jgi:hypothetical protein